MSQKEGEGLGRVSDVTGRGGGGRGGGRGELVTSQEGEEDES